MPSSKEQAVANLEKARKVGRPKGKLPSTILKEKAQLNFAKRASKMSSKLYNAQAVQALGSWKMITITTDEFGQKHVRTIRDEKEIEILLDTGEVNVDYFLVVGAMPDYKASDAILNRAWGKPKESIDLDINVKVSLKELAEKRKEFLNATVVSPTVEIKTPNTLQNAIVDAVIHREDNQDEDETI